MDMSNPYAVHGAKTVVAMAQESERTAFIRRTYTHLTGAIAAFVALEALLLAVVPIQNIMWMFGGYMWLGILAAFMGVSWLADYWARSDQPPRMQYAGLGIYVVAEALIFLPLMAIAIHKDANIPMVAGLTTAVIFGGMTAMVFVTKSDLSWMGKYLTIGGLAAMALIFIGVVFGFSLGIWFTVAMIVFAAAYIMYNTSNIMHHYHTDQHVAASLTLFASVTLMLWYVVQLFMSFDD